MIVVDTTVLVYAVGAEHPLRDPCRDLVAAIGDGRHAATTTVEAIQEFAHVRSIRRDRPDAVRLARQYATMLSPLVRPDRGDLDRGLDVFAAVPALGACDAVLAATVLNHDELEGLASADKAFREILGLSHLDPGDPDFADRLTDRSRRAPS